MPKVYVVGRDTAINNMFVRSGWEITSFPDDADLIQFHGGADISPHLYGQTKHPETHTDPKRDEIEINIFNFYKETKKFAGICRGGQLLNVLSGGSLWQHVDGHEMNGIHRGYEPDGTIHLISSSHHQMMIPASDGDVLLSAIRSTFRASNSEVNRTKDYQDTEAVFYPKTMCLCYQPHPEWNKHEDDPNLYFNYLESCLGLKVKGQ